MNLKTTVLLLLFAPQLFAQDKTSGYTLQQAIDYALQNHANVKNATLDAEIAQKRVNELIGVGLPQLNGSVNYNYFIEIPTTVIPARAFAPEAPADLLNAVQFGTTQNATAGANASQLIFDGSFFLGVKAAKTYVELSRKTAEQTKIETAIAVSKAYYSVLVNQERMDLLKANVTRIKKLKDDTQALYDNGFVEKIDNDRIQVTYNNMVVEKEKTERLLALGLDLLKFQMGMELNTQITLTDKLETALLDESVLSNENIDVNKRIEINILNTTKKLQELNIKVNKYKSYPSLIAFGTFSENAYRLDFDFFDSDKRWYPTAIVGATLNIPLIGGFSRHNKVQQEKLTLKKIENSYQSLSNGITLEIKTARTQFQNALASLQTQKKNRELASEVASVSKIKYDQGVGSNLEVVTAETSLKEAETNYYGALYDALISKIDFAKATGNIIK